jgi:hypothetical protein
MLAVAGPAGLLPFGRDRSPVEWRAIRLRLKQAVFAENLRRALAGQEIGTGQILIVGGAAADEELLGVLLRSLPPGASVGMGSVGGTLSGPTSSCSRWTDTAPAQTRLSPMRVRVSSSR